MTMPVHSGATHAPNRGSYGWSVIMQMAAQCVA